MLSILIPTYNYDVTTLVIELQKQCLGLEITFEILVIDDCSTLFVTENQVINSYKNCRFEVLDKNSGRSAIRNLLASKAKFQHLLFLDADTLPTNSNFILNYISYITTEEKIVYGGIEYEKIQPEKNKLLRWVYGTKREALSIKKRIQNPYLSFLTLQFLIHKNVFKKVSFNETIPNLRHEDTLFSYNLMQQNIPIIHIENTVYHLGLDDFDVAIQKENDAIVALKYLIDHELISPNYVKLSKIYTLIKKLKLTFAFALFHKITYSVFLKNLSGNKPSLFIFDLYKLGKICSFEK